MEMELTSKCNNGNTFPNIQQSHNPRIRDDFWIDSISSRDFVQEFQHLDNYFSITGSSFNPDIGIQTNGYDDPFDPSSQHHPTATTFNTTKNDVYEFTKSCSSFGENGGRLMMQNFQGVTGGRGLFGYLNKNISMDYNNNYGDLSFLSVNNYEDVKPPNLVVPDESSYISTAGNGQFYKGDTATKKNSNTTKKGSRRRKTPKTTKGQWNPEEDRLLIKLVEKHGVRKWSLIAQILKGRIGKQCRERWYNHLRPNIKKDGWTDEEDKILIEVHRKVGNKWSEIAKRLPRRTENSIKNHWNATKRRQFSKRKCRTKKSQNSSLLLQDYIKSLSLDKKPNKRYTSRGTAAAVIYAPPPREVVDLCHLPNNQGWKFVTKTESHYGDDRLVPDYDFDEIPEFEFPLHNKMFEENGIDSLMIADLPPIPEDEQCYGLHMSYHQNLPQDPPLMQRVCKKELDLVDFINM